jgi:pilus assembly protein Flp/PilA
MWLRVISFQLEVLALFMSRTLRRFWREDEGASMVEYAILVALIAIVAIAAVQSLGNGIAQVFQNILGRIQGLGR